MDHQRLQEIREFIGQRPPAVNSFLITLRSDGTPFIRQVSTFIEGWTIQTVSNAANLKVRHIRNNPAVSYLWVQQRPQFGAKNVWVNGVAEIVSDPAEVQAFLERRAAATGTPVPPAEFERVVIRVVPTFLRAEGFAAGPRPEVFRNFAA
ncbi:MAG: pyridoxamine 5'-phosphate oxidase family protein [Chloroflexota bacterium]|nr:pyridoxamine 5'-phosphate oxidase family protein [Dehalococcoidia bacterium]MDW8253537.1 pyridoxamine 5'-phosphate oxidase family protein [Chloroflexota bacterium]